MYLAIKKVLLSNAMMIVCSIIIGYSLWLMLSQNQIIQQTLAIPVHIHDQDEVVSKNPIHALIEGTREQLRSLRYHTPAIHLYLDEIKHPTYEIKANDILLPETLTVIKFWPKIINLTER